MGQGASTSQRLADVSVEALAGIVEGLGPKYEAYGAAVRDNGVDGELLDSLNDESFQETLEGLEVSRLHQRVLTKEWVKWKERDRRPEAAPVAAPRPAPQRTSNKAIARALAEGHPEYLLEHNITLSEEERRELIEAAASYQLTEETPESELEGFDRTASKGFELCKALFCGVHLIEDDGHFVLGTRFYSSRDGVKEVRKDRIHAPRELSRCYGAILGNENDFIVNKIDPGTSPFQSPEKSSEYIAHILHTPDDKRIGVVCAVVEGDEDKEERHAILKELAAEAEEQLRVRKALLSRTYVLQEQINQLKVSKESMVLPSYGPVRGISREAVAQRGPALYPMPNEVSASGKPRRSADLPFVQENRASPEEMSHLPDNFYAIADAMGADHCPIAKDDMQRIAVVESLGLKELTHDHPTGIALKRLVTLGARLFGVSYAEISFQTHTEYFTFARYTSCTEEQKAIMFKFYKEINQDENGEPWLMAFPENYRCLSLCSYTMSTKKTMAVHDVWNDESFKWVSGHDAFKFYSGSPIFVNGHAVATFCMMDFRTRPDFSQAHEMQQEQIAMLISQQIEAWALRRDMERLEKERRRLEAPLLKASPPQRHAALVFTDVQGSTSLWEANSNAMNEALALHDQIMRNGIANHHGYEVTTEGDAFHIAFHDAIDAVCFALEAQMALHDASWSDDILALPEACSDGNTFRGLRVRMAIHAGDVASRDNEVSGRREFKGPTFYVTKSLEGMAHGGQVLVTSDVWNMASHVSESKLGSPQVLDLGLHVLLKGKAKQDGLIAKHVLQLVPSSLAYDYMQHRTLTDDKSPSEISCVVGRCFPPAISPKRLSASFHEAPFANNQVTMAFVYTSQIEALYDDPSTILAVLSNRIGVFLTSEPGYQCKDFMLVFASPSEAISFGLKLQEYLKDNRVADESLAGLVQFGLHEGTFSSMGPHKTTGRADYFGKVVNRAARVAGAAEPGQVCMGTCVCGADSDDALTNDDRVLLLEKGFIASFVGTRRLKGVQEEMALYVCSHIIDDE